MADAAQPRLPLRRVPSGIPGLDRIINGGLFQGGIYIIMGHPGAGKTILGNQIAFNHVARGGKVLYVTLLAETHARMLSHLQSMSFFDPRPIAESLYYISAYQVLEEEGLPGLLSLLRTTVRDREASLLVLDGLVTAEVVADSPNQFKHFLHQLQIYTDAMGCTTLLLTQSGGDLQPRPEHTMVDGLIEIRQQPVGLRTARELEVHKFRGSNHLEGRHMFQISDAGIVVYPRTEALFVRPTRPLTDSDAQQGFGNAGLDAMLGGGLRLGSTTMLLGAPGSGKTVLGLHFLMAGASLGEPALHFGFFEQPARLAAKGDQLGLNVTAALASGQLEIIWRSPLGNLIDALAAELLEAVERRGVRRLFIDGLSGLERAAFYPARLGNFFTALTQELAAREVTTIFAVELPQLFGAAIELPFAGISAIAENVVLLRYTELNAQLHRTISILKMRDQPYDPSIRTFTISDQGIDLQASFESAEAILTGIARPVLSSPPPS
jgi:circadian clock protein KaiC